MALSAKARKRLEVAMAKRAEAKEIADAIDAGGNSPAAHVANVTAANAATQTASYVQADAQTIATLANANKVTINQILAALQAAGIML